MKIKREGKKHNYAGVINANIQGNMKFEWIKLFL